jgi:hypothetical protein
VAVTSYTLDFGDGSAPVTQNSPAFTHQYSAPGNYPARLTVKDANNTVSVNPAQVIITVTGGAPAVAGVVSRKTHTGVGDFDIVMPGIECRTGGTQGLHTLVIAFANTVANVGSATATATTSSGSQAVSVLNTSGIGTDTHQYVANLSGVPNASRVAVTLHNVIDSAGNSGDVVVNANFLEGDTTGNGAANSSDISQTQAESGHPVSSANFREDVTSNGAINSSDISVVQSRSGTVLPAAGAAPASTVSPAPATTPPSTSPTSGKPRHKRPRGSNNSF